MVNVFGSAPAGLQGFVEPEREDFKLIDHVGKAGIFKVQGPQEVTTKRYGVKTAIKVDVVIFDADGNTQAFSDVLIFNAAPVQQLKPYAGQELVALIEEYETDQGSRAPKLAAPDPSVVEVAKKLKK